MKRLLRFKYYSRSSYARAGLIHGESFAELVPQVEEIMFSESMPDGKHFVFKSKVLSFKFPVKSLHARKNKTKQNKNIIYVY